MTTAVSVRQNHIISIMFARHSNEQRLLRWLQSIAEGIQQRPSVYPSVRLSVHAIHFLTVMRVSLQERLYQSGCCLEADSCGPKESCIRLGCTFSPPGEHVGMTFATAGRDAGCHHHYCNNLHVSGFVRQIKLAFHQFLRVYRKASFTAHELNWTELIWTSHMQSSSSHTGLLSFVLIGCRHSKLGRIVRVHITSTFFAHVQNSSSVQFM